MSEDVEYLKNYLPETLYVHPAQVGAYATLVSEGETPLAEIEVTPRSRLAISLFYIRDKKDFGTFKLSKLKYHAKFGWQLDGTIQINSFHLSHLREFVTLLSSLDFSDTRKTRLSLQHVNLETLKTLVASSRGKDMLKALSEAPELHQDIYAVAAKRQALQQFEENLTGRLTEPEWQRFFEANTWIFGHGLNYVFLEKAAPKLETRTTGKTFDRHGKTTDGLMRTRAEVSQYVLIEIKKSDTDLLQRSTYRSGCWAVSHELSDAVTQIQKTTFEFTRDRFRDRRKDMEGFDLSGDTYSVDPQTYLVIGHQQQLGGNEDKVACFELYRRNVRAPNILTFDELYFRARCIVENLSDASRQDEPGDEIPF